MFKTLAISKTIYLTFLTVIPNSLIEELKKSKKRLYGTPVVEKFVTKDYVTILKMLD